ncbi:hypothetical protein CVT26_002782 [Gymnopilus dilepis]|uniref:UBC core domain-containing protein n=1 Tax=Gymnopilus dilepis TaxID=231916 RepID=A0A409VCC0_9AGAR|nr:hypothetical protein CVT26_002782 [Gymnopilus dilepis]
MEQLNAAVAPPRTAAKVNVPPAGQQTAGSVAKRLSNELMTLMMSASPGIVYAGLTFKISISFPSNYPYVPPTIRFDTPCYHPNVDIASGSICLDILQDKWSAVYSVQTILLSLQSLLGEPNNASPLNPEAAGLWADPTAFKSQMLKYYRPVGDSS